MPLGFPGKRQSVEKPRLSSSRLLDAAVERQVAQLQYTRPFFLRLCTWGWFVKKGTAMSVVVEPSAREMFTPRELSAAFKEFIERGPQYLEAETGIRASTHQFGKRVLLVYQESETGLVVLIHPSA